MTDNEVFRTAAIGLLIFSLFIGIIVYAALSEAEASTRTMIGPETQISMADLCPEGTN